MTEKAVYVLVAAAGKHDNKKMTALFDTKCFQVAGKKYSVEGHDKRVTKVMIDDGVGMEIWLPTEFLSQPKDK